MKKVLSIIVPSYNMEAFLPACIDSLMRAVSLAEMEIIIVNDGSRDRTSMVAHSYAERYPSSISVIDKPNGNYGSTVNAALAVAAGEYVRILDADDAFDSPRIADYIDALKKLSGTDMIVSPFTEVRGKKITRVDYDIYARKTYKTMTPYDADTVFADGKIHFFMMHSVCYRTEMLRRMEYRQSEGISYTDQEWVFYPLFRVRTIAFTDIALYRYNLSREGQSMDRAVQLRRISELVQMTENMAGYFVAARTKRLSAPRAAFLREVLVRRFRIVYRKYLLEFSPKAFAGSGFAQVDARLSALAHSGGFGNMSVPVNNLLPVNILGRWRRRGRRYSPFVLWLLRAADSLMVSTHRAIFG